MYLIIATILSYVAAVFLYIIPFLIPDQRMMFFQYLGIFMMAIPNVILWQRVIVSQTYYDVDKQQKWKQLIEYLRRDNHIVTLQGVRAYPGESFIDVPQLGLMEFLGKDCYYSKGDKKKIFGLENINYSPDIRYSNLCHLLWELGFRTSEDISNVLQGKDLHLMGIVYQRMLAYDEHHGVNKLVAEMRDYDGPVVKFKPTNISQTGAIKTIATATKHDGMRDRIDSLIKGWNER